jgi:hypothetical protein
VLTLSQDKIAEFTVSKVGVDENYAFELYQVR